MADAPLQLFNSLNRQVEPFVPIHDGEARVYTCGPTVYNYAHIGNMRAYVFADVLGRALSWKGYDLKHVINITDVGHLTDDADSGEDKLERAAAGTDKSIWDIARHYTDAFKADMRALNIREPAHWSVATDYIEPMIAFAKGIAEKHCYEIDSGLYFDVSTVEDYGRLARAVTEEGEGRIETVEGKRNAADFAIWRKTPPGEARQMEWESPWGKGAPGWHLECSVMGEKLLGFPFDIHTGGIDHREIHHPNEIAQNQAFCGCGGLSDATNSGARFWMHNNFLVERSGKMSKSGGEFLRLQLLVDKGYHPLAYRMMCLQAHYRSELEFSWEGLEAALTRLKRFAAQISKLRLGKMKTTQWVRNQRRYNDWKSILAKYDSPNLTSIVKEFDSAVSNDLSIPKGLVVFESLLKSSTFADPQKIVGAMLMDEVLGLGLTDKGRKLLRRKPKQAYQKQFLTENFISQRLKNRLEAKRSRDFERADAIRSELEELGVEVMDGDPLGWEWKLK
ncbi:MAG: cysteine--tRNA ligase [Erythrobacter sp.]